MVAIQNDWENVESCPGRKTTPHPNRTKILTMNALVGIIIPHYPISHPCITITLLHSLLLIYSQFASF